MVILMGKDIVQLETDISVPSPLRGTQLITSFYSFSNCLIFLDLMKQTYTSLFCCCFCVCVCVCLLLMICFSLPQ